MILPPVQRADVTSPVRGELHLVALAGHELWDERQVWDLSGRPAELEDDDEGGEVKKLSPLRRVGVTGQAGVKNEGERHHDTNSSWEKRGKYYHYYYGGLLIYNPSNISEWKWPNTKWSKIH